MKCEKCGGKGFIEFEHGLLMVGCDECDGKGEVEGIITVEGTGGIYTGLYFQLTGPRTNEYSDYILWTKAKSEALKSMEFPYTVAMPCGSKKSFDAPSSIKGLPAKDIPCPCGDPSHYIVRFIDVRNESDSGIGQPDTAIGSGDTSKSKQPKKQKPKKKAGKRAG